MTPMSENPVAVTQADRDAAAAYLKGNEPYWIDRVSAIHSGSDDALVQAFARHRLAGLEREADGAPGGASGEGEPDTAFAISKRRHEDRQAALASATEAPPVAGVGEVECERCHLDGLFHVGPCTRTKPTPPASGSGEVVVERIATLFPAIAHGDDEHREWLEKAIADHFAGRPVERPRGKGTQLTAAPEAATPSALGGVDRMREAASAVVRRAMQEEFLYGSRWENSAGRVVNRCAVADRAVDQIIALASGETSPERARIDERHRYLIKRNADGMFVGSTDDLGAILPPGHRLIDTIGEDGLGLGIVHYLKSRAALTEQPRTSENR